MSECGEEEILPFHLLVDRNVGTDVVQAFWCPSMDLIGIISTKGDVWIQRAGSGTSWTRLHSLTSSTSSPITSLAWRVPDGKAIACSYQDGSISLFDVESGIELLSNNVHDTPIQYLQWSSMDCNFSTNNSMNDRSGLLPEQNIITDDDNMFDSPTGSTPLILTTPAKDSLPILCSLSHDRIVLSMFGNFTVGKIDISSQMISLGAPKVEKLLTGYLSSDFHCISCIGSTQNEKERFLVIVDSFLLAERKKELQSIANESFYISVILQQCGSFLEKLKSNWKSSISSFLSKFNVYSSHLRDEGSSSTLEEDLILLLATGISSPALERFLCSTIKLSIKQMSRLAKSLDSACANVQTVCLSLLEKTIEALIFRLGELEGLAKCDNYASIGLDDKTLTQCIQAAAGFILLLRKLTNEVTTYRKQLEEFFQWLTMMQHVLQHSEDESEWKPLNNAVIDEQNILRFIESGMRNDLISKILSDENTYGNEENEWRIRLKHNLHYNMPDSLSLPVAFQSINELCKQLFEAPSEYCSRSFSVFRCFPIPNFVHLNEAGTISQSVCFQNIKHPESGNNYQQVGFIVNDGEQDSVQMLRFDTKIKENSASSFVVESLCLPLNKKIRQFAFYVPFNFCLVSECDGSYALEMGNYEEEEWIEHLVDSIEFQGTDNFENLRSREIDGIPKLLSVSQGRGVGSLTCENRRIIIFDLEDDEYPEEEEEDFDDMDE